MKQIVYETTKVNISNLLRDKKTATGSIGQWFQKPPLVNKEE